VLLDDDNNMKIYKVNLLRTVKVSDKNKQIENFLYSYMFEHSNRNVQH